MFLSEFSFAKNFWVSGIFSWSWWPRSPSVAAPRASCRPLPQHFPSCPQPPFPLPSPATCVPAAGPRACLLILLPGLREVATRSVTCSPGDGAPVTVAHHTHWPNESCDPPAMRVLTGRGTRFPPSSLIQDYVTLRGEAKDLRKPQRRREKGSRGSVGWVLDTQK